VTTVTGPEPALTGTVTVRLVAVAVFTAARTAPIDTVSFAGFASNPEPDTVTVAPGTTTDGVNPETTGATTGASTTNGCWLPAEPPDVVTVTVPVVAPAGTVTVTLVADAADTVAAFPLNDTVLPAGVAANPVPEIVTVAPTDARAGTTLTTDTAVDA
jgi:hypothetical protein